MPKILVPSAGPGDWKCLLAEPERHWARGKSARTLAHCWEDGDGFPPEITAILRHSALRELEPLLIFPEWKVPLPAGRKPSHNDVWVLARAEDGLVSIAIEGKVEEPFDQILGKWKKNASSGKNTSVPHFQHHASDNWEPEGAGSDGVVNRSWSGRRSNMLSWSTCSIW